MNKFNFSITIPIIIVICLLLSLALGVGILLPKYQDLKALQDKIKEKKDELQYKEKYFARLSQISTELEKYQEELLKIDSALPTGPSIPSLFNFLQKTSSQAGLVLKEISPFTITSLEDSPDIKEIHLSLGVLGSYSSFKDFLSLLEKSARFIEVESFSFSSPQKKGPFTFNLTIKVFSY